MGFVPSVDVLYDIVQRMYTVVFIQVFYKLKLVGNWYKLHTQLVTAALGRLVRTNGWAGVQYLTTKKQPQHHPHNLLHEQYGQIRQYLHSYIVTNSIT